MQLPPSPFSTFISIPVDSKHRLTSFERDVLPRRALFLSASKVFARFKFVRAEMEAFKGIRSKTLSSYFIRCANNSPFPLFLVFSTNSRFYYANRIQDYPIVSDKITIIHSSSSNFLGALERIIVVFGIKIFKFKLFQ